MTHPLQSTADQFISQMNSAHGAQVTLRAIALMAGYEEPPPTVEQFIDDQHFLGDFLGQSIFPIWRAALKEVYPNQFHSPYADIILTGGIGLGKSTMALAGLAYDLVKVLHLSNPHKSYQLIKSTKIAFALINATQSLAQGVLYDQLMDWIFNSPYFKMQMKKSSGLTLFPNKVNIITGSRFTSFIGMAIPGAIMSEANFQTKVHGQAEENYNAIIARRESRFKGYHSKFGSYPGRIWIDSSKTDTASFIDEIVIKKRQDDPTLKIYDYALWEAQGHKLGLSGKTFKVFAGDETKDPKIFESWDSHIGYDEARIIDVPVEFKQKFESDIFIALKDLAGISTQGAHKFISAPDRLHDAYLRENPVTKQVISLDFYSLEDRLINFIDFTRIKDDSRPRFVHIDLGLVHDKTGIAFTRIDGVTTIEYTDQVTGQYVVERKPVYYTDFVMAIESKPGQEVPIYKIKNLLIELRGRGYPIAVVSTDGYQSTNLRQDLNLEGFETELLSVDRTMDPYIEFKNSILEGRWNGVKHPILSDELRGLERSGGKVDHVPGASKDISDAVCGSIWLAKKHMHRLRADMTTANVIDQLSAVGASKYDNILRGNRR